MSDLYQDADERGRVRVFAAPGTPERWKTEIGAVDAIEEALGVALKPAYVEAFDRADLGSMTLSHYLREAHSVEIAPEEADMLDARAGTIVVIPSSAVDGEAEFIEADGWSFLGLYSEPFEPIDYAPLPDDGARLQHSADEEPAAPRSDARIGGMVALIALIVLFLLVAMMIWIAG